MSQFSNIIQKKRHLICHQVITTMPNASQASHSSSSSLSVSSQGCRNNQCGSGGGRGQGHGSGGARHGKPRKSLPQKSTKFQGVCPDLKDAIFNCSDYRQADCYTTAVKHVAEYVGTNYKNGGNISSFI